MPKHRMHRGLVALSASAVAAVYLAGYVQTQPADASLAANEPGTPTAVVVAAATPTTIVRAAPRPTSAASSTSTTSPISPASPASPTSPASRTSPAVAAAYKDGRYSGQGSSRRGDVWVSVDIAGGQITNVTITRSTLQYPVRDIAGLPAQVVQRQSAQVDTISRATYSSQAFKTAVSQALAAAR